MKYEYKAKWMVSAISDIEHNQIIGYKHEG